MRLRQKRHNPPVGCFCRLGRLMSYRENCVCLAIWKSLSEPQPIAALPDGEKTSDSNLPGVLAEEPRPFARGTTKKTRPGQCERKMACGGSPSCAGCYDVGDGNKIHPPKCGEEYRKWHERSIAATSLICSLIPCVIWSPHQF